MSTPPPTRPAQGNTPRSRLQESSPSRGASPAPAAQGLVRNPSLRSARPIRKAPIRNSVGGDMLVDEDAKTANAQVIADLKEQVDRAEQASEQYRRQLDTMQRRLDEVSNQTTAAEEREFQFRTKIDKLQAELRENARQSRELEVSFQSERKMLLRDSENRGSKEAELQSVVSRLTETLKLRNQELASTNKIDKDAQASGTLDNLGAGDSQDYLRLLEQKNSDIEALRLELADLHLRMAEQEHMGDGRSQIIEKELVEIKMRSARLQEENESFQMLLSEKTLKGDFLHDQSNVQPVASSSLAEELATVDENADLASAEGPKGLEFENKALKDSNKALTLYIDKIIGRLLKHEGFEHIITDKDEDDPDVPLSKFSANKALPDLPTDSQEHSKPSAISTPIANATSVAAGFLQRARSVVSRPTAPRSRPLSSMPLATSTNENPETAPSIPLNRGHRRARSDQAAEAGATGATATQQINRGSPLRTPSGGPLSPVLGPLSSISSHRLSQPGMPSATSTTRAMSGPIQPGRPTSSSNSAMSEHSQDLERESTDASSTRASVYSSTSTTVPGAVMKQSQLRPLRLVQEKVQTDEEAQKRANRGSWMGWFNKGPAEHANESSG